ncbi:hypothetical protein Taro_042069 [Colocasia esculenta]|uniref:Uncharacterized protein n=1 Tax=Colocasia esculenta TaxID=4460 RepID=A0A843WFX6_COLES|nr:hypothetical protein [Colocasia esculenta]
MRENKFFFSSTWRLVATEWNKCSWCRVVQHYSRAVVATSPSNDSSTTQQQKKEFTVVSTQSMGVSTLVLFSRNSKQQKSQWCRHSPWMCRH